MLFRSATLPEQRVLRGTLAGIAELGSRAAVSAPALLIVGEVVAMAGGAEPAPRPVAAETAADLTQPI